MTITPATGIHAPSSTTAKPKPIPLEIHIGKLVALAASALARGVMDYRNSGRMSLQTKLRTANLFSELYELRRAMVPYWDFDGLAHEHGRQWLIEACGGANAGEQRILDELVNGVMEILRKVVTSQLN